MTTTIDSAGRIALPRELSERLGLLPGDEVTVEERDGAVYVLPTTDRGLCWEGGVLVHKGHSDQSANDALAELRDERLSALVQEPRQ